MALERKEEDKKEDILGNESTPFLKIFKRLLHRWVTRPVFFVLLLFLTLAALLALPAVQSFLARQAVAYVFKNSHYNADIERLLVNLPNRSIHLRNVHIYDEHFVDLVDIEEIRVTFSLTQLLIGRVRIKEARLENGLFNMHYDIQHQGFNINLFIEELNERFGSQSSSSQPAPFIIEKAYLNNMQFRYHDGRQDSLPGGFFDYAHFSLNNIYGTVLDFKAFGDTIALSTRQLQFHEPQSSLYVKSLDTDFHMDAQHMYFDRLHLYLNNSYLGDKVRFSYESMSAMGAFVDSVLLDIHFEGSRIHPADLAPFHEVFAQWQDEWQINGQVNGTIREFVWEDAYLRFGNDSYLQGIISTQGLPDIEAAVIEADIPSLSLKMEDLKQYLPASLHPWLQKIDFIDGELRLDGYAKDFNYTTQLYTALGEISSEGEVFYKEEAPALPHYNIRLDLTDFRLGYLIDQSMLGTLTAHMELDGYGTDLHRHDFNLSATIDEFVVNGYAYRQLQLSGNSSNALLNGTLHSEDPNARLHLLLKGAFLKDSLRFAKLQGGIDYLDLQATHWLDTTARISTQIQGEYSEFKSVDARLHFQNVQFLYGNHTLTTHQLTLTYYRRASQAEEKLQLLSDYVTVSLEGHYDNGQLIRYLQEVPYELWLAVSKQQQVQKDYYAQKASASGAHNDSLHIQMEVICTNLNPVLQLFAPNAYLSHNSRLSGEFIQSADSSILRIATQTPIDTLQWGAERFYESALDVEMYKPRYGADVLAQLDLLSARQEIGGIRTRQLLLNASWYNDAIEFRQYIRVDNDTLLSELKLQGALELGESQQTLYFYDSHLTLGGAQWDIESFRNIQFSTDSSRQVTFDRFTLSHQGQSIVLHGNIAEASFPHQLQVDFNMVNLRPFSALASIPVDGTLLGSFTLRNLYTSTPIIEGEAEVEDLTFQNIYVGYLSSVVGWDAQTGSIIFNADLYNRVDYVFFMSGHYRHSSGQIQVIAEMKETELKVLNPFLKDYLSEIGGTVSGKLALRGSLDKPLLAGILDFKQATFKVNYLGTTYSFSDKLYITPDAIRMRRLRIMDNRQGNAVFTGDIYHHYFQDFYLDIRGEFKKFLVLNTPPREGELYYGDALVSGDAQISGTPDNLYLQANARTEYGTKLYIPLYGSEKVSQKDYIVFKDFENDKNNQSETKEVKLQNLRMDFNLDVTPDAYFEIIFDPRAGDIMRGNGQGRIQMSIDSRGEFTMWGDFYIKEGSYNFTMLNLVNKQFKVREGSAIYFIGDVYSAELDIKAYYETITSLLPLLNSSNTELNSPEYTRRYPVQVLLHLTGPMLAPDIRFDIDFSEVERSITNPALRSALYSFKGRIEGDEQERNRQVFSLILFKKFSGENSFSGISGAGGNTVSELLSNQLSHWMSQVDENLQIDVDLSGWDKQSNNVFHVRLSYTFLDGRLRITRDGLIDTQNQSATANIVGEWTVEYMLTPDGRYRLKMYNKNLSNGVVTSISNSTNTAAGFSILYTRDFNSIWELFSRKKKDKSNQKILPRPDGLLKEEEPSEKQETTGEEVQ
ncbi:MAG: hypothetical protein KatS3mg033_0546 [Thermonema sp.]|uniref:translocation/assembly module TamB domain-containing protein n=1 Tax=Thermonema sp. TaxID=2231181 RepID=UPI0021DDDE05|nr:translocation/assembly module TamB domain-containing protein [Thermonema sp.]GIV38746.1 MAG: hypothetical protein KatS3mg033_0546 [Thermonema sp.]